MTIPEREEFQKIVEDSLPEEFVFDGPVDEWWRASLLTDLGLDSLATVGLILEIEDAFGLEIPDETLTMDVFKSPESLWSLVVKIAQEHD